MNNKSESEAMHVNTKQLLHVFVKFEKENKKKM